jgi:serine/threonine-protein kinase
MDEEDPLRPGDRLDRYELICPIASGGMARVWLARLRGKRGFEKLVAIKTIRTELIDDPRFQEMFLDEARIASGIQHPNVAQIIDLGEENETLYIVMEWVDGESLAKIRRLSAKRGHPLPLGITLRIMADACAGLHAAHELRDVHGNIVEIVHRDVSPQNLLVSVSGAVKVIDFGVAKARNRRAGDTRTGVVKGKIHYMSPEQAHGRALDRRGDVWSIGVCLQELVTGKLPFDDDSDIDVVRRLMSDEPPPKPGSSVPEPIVEIVAHSVVRNPDERFATAEAMQRAIETAIDRLGLTATSTDVAEFLRAAVPDLAEKRQKVVLEAIAVADARAISGHTPVTNAPRIRAASLRDREEEAFAPTVMSDPTPQVNRPSQDAETLALVRKKPRSSKEESGAGATLGSATLAADDDDDIEVAGLPKRRGWVLAGLLVVVASAAWFGWKRDGVGKIRAWLVASSPPTQAASASPSTTVTPSATAAAVTSGAPSASASGAPAHSAHASGPWPLVVPPALQAASAAATRSAPPAPSAPPSPLATASQAAGAPSAPPSAPAASASAAAPVSAPSPAPSTPPASTGDNPY